MQPIKTIKVKPIGKPRMTQRDRWKNRPCVARYHQFKDALRQQWGNDDLPHTLWIVCYIPMPKSWSKKKRREMLGQPHQQKPDADNVMKAFKDTLYKDDAVVWDERCTKFWCEDDQLGMIEVYELPRVEVAT